MAAELCALKLIYNTAGDESPFPTVLRYCYFNALHEPNFPLLYMCFEVVFSFHEGTLYNIYYNIPIYDIRNILYVILLPQMYYNNLEQCFEDIIFCHYLLVTLNDVLSFMPRP